MDTRKFICALALTVFMAGPASADWKTAAAAYSRGDYAVALREWRGLAEQGNAAAQYALGLLHRKGIGVKQNYAEALKWYRKAAEQGHAVAQNNLGFMYYNGYGVRRDYIEAHRWYNLASLQGFTKARKNRDHTAAQMTPKQVAEAWKLAQEWRAKHGKRKY